MSDALATSPVIPSASPAPVVLCERVSVRYGKNQALRDVSAAFLPGAIGLLGPNGAGKSTLLKTLLGFVVPERGRMTVLGLDVAREPLEIRARLGYMPETDAHIPGMNAVSFVAYCGQLSGLPPADAMQRAHEVLYYVGLGEARYRNLETYSTGMKQRIKLAQAIVHDPDLLFLDEPTTGFDPAARRAAWQTVRSLAELGKTVLLTTHYLDEAQALCDRVAIVKDGRIVATGAPAELDSGAARYRVAWRGRDGELQTRETDDPTALLHQLTSEALAHGGTLRDLSVSRPTLEEIYLELVEADG